jgi:hypothetical protein
MDHALTVRLPDSVYRAARNMAERCGISMNRLVQSPSGRGLRGGTEESGKADLRRSGRPRSPGDPW